MVLRSYRGKRTFDLLLTVPALIVFSPLMAAIAVLVRWSHGRPVIFRQLRPGLAGRPFTILKFRTMTDAKDPEGNLLPAEARVTRLGRLLRRSSMDELPEFINVLRGDMSLVGPRPLLMQYLDHYTPEQMQRHDARPGITGWAQVNGRNNVTWDEKFALDLWYVNHLSLTVDCKIMLLTIWKSVRGGDINKEGYEGMDYFHGSYPVNK